VGHSFEPESRQISAGGSEHDGEEWAGGNAPRLAVMENCRCIK
jgi:hypothetical protein